jgi:hypothetical protein
VTPHSTPLRIWTLPSRQRRAVKARRVGLFALGCESALAWAAPVELGLDVVVGEREEGGDAVDDAADAMAVGLALAVSAL